MYCRALSPRQMMGLYRALKRVFGSIGLYVDTATSTAWTYLYPPKTDLQMCSIATTFSYVSMDKSILIFVK
jgi:hypothetical protein